MKAMKASELKVGDWIKIIAIPGEGIPNYTIFPETIRVYKKLVARKRPVRIREIDEYGSPWFRCKFRRRNGAWEIHELVVMETDTNWKCVRRQNSN